MPEGWRYELTARSPARFRASGLDAAHRISRRIADVVNTALASDPEVIEVETHAFFDADSPTCDRTRACTANLHYADCPRSG